MTATIDTLPFTRREQLRLRNESAAEYLLNNTDIPRPVSVEPRQDAVYVTVASPESLLPWLDELGGCLQVVDLPSGFRVWTLRAAYPWIADESVHVRVAAVSPLLDDEMSPDLRIAVAA
jgi:hypothetical protein